MAFKLIYSFILPIMLSIPRLIKWIFFLGLFFLLLMALWRLGTYAIFKMDHSSFKDSLPAFWLGFRYDARMVCIVLLVILLFGSIPSLHPFDSKTGKKLWLFFTGLFAVVLLFFYVFD